MEVRKEWRGRCFVIDWISGVMEKEEDSVAYDVSATWAVVPSINQKKGQKRERPYKVEGHLSSVVSAVRQSGNI